MWLVGCSRLLMAALVVVLAAVGLSAVGCSWLLTAAILSPWLVSSPPSGVVLPRKNPPLCRFGCRGLPLAAVVCRWFGCSWLLTAAVVVVLAAIQGCAHGCSRLLTAAILSPLGCAVGCRCHRPIFCGSRFFRRCSRLPWSAVFGCHGLPLSHMQLSRTGGVGAGKPGCRAFHQR